MPDYDQQIRQRLKTRRERILLVRALFAQGRRRTHLSPSSRQPQCRPLGDLEFPCLLTPTFGPVAGSALRLCSYRRSTLSTLAAHALSERGPFFTSHQNPSVSCIVLLFGTEFSLPDDAFKDGQVSRYQTSLRSTPTAAKSQVVAIRASPKASSRLRGEA